MNALRFALRQLLQNPGFSATAIATLGLGIGLVTTQFSLMEGVLLRSMPFPESDRLYHLGRQSVSDLSDQWQPMPMRDFLIHRERQTTFDDLAAFSDESVNVSRHGNPAQRYSGAAVSANFFDVLRAQPMLGRAFLPGEDEPGREGLVLIGHEFWQQECGGSPEVLGRVIHLNGEPATIIGVMPPKFRFPVQQALWSNLREGPRDPRDGVVRRVEGMGRLKAGISRAQAVANLGVIARQLEEAFPETNRGIHRLHVARFAEAYAGVGARSILLTMLAMTLFVLLLACANVTNLLLARAAGRWRELAVRSALGAGRWRLIRQMLGESLTFAVGGALVGVVLAFWGVLILNDQVVGHMDVPFFMRFELHPLILATTAGVTLLAGLAAGVAPAFHAGHVAIHGALKDGDRGGSGPRLGRFTRGLVIGQVGLACALVIAATMMAENVIRARTVRLTDNPDALLVGRLELHGRTHPEKADRVRFFRQLVNRVGELPGVEAVAVSSRDLVGSAVHTRFEKEGEAYAHANDKPGGWVEVVSREYFRLTGIGAIEGRLFDVTDLEEGPVAALVNRSFARRHWPGESPLGKRLRRDEAGAAWASVVGVVPDLYMEGLGNNDPAAGFYLLQDQQGWGWMHLLVRSKAEAAALLPSLRAVLNTLDPDQPLHSIGTLRSHASRRLRAISIVGTMAGVFALAAAVLAAVGIYGVMSLTVSRRTREFGIRMALGARVNDVLRQVMGLGLRQLGVGLGLGLLLAFGLSRPLAPLLSGGVTGDARIYLGVATMIACVALVAIWLPARRAARVNPMVALRSE